MANGKCKVCWDSCAYISLLTGENRTLEEMKKLYEIEHMANQGKAIIFTSSVTMVEVLECKLTADQAAKFKGLIGNPDTPFVPLDTKLADLAHEIRNFYAGKISVPDAIQLATAIKYEAVALHTYDGCSKKKRPGDLLRLTQPIAGKYAIPITIPQIPKDDKNEPPPPPLVAAAAAAEAQSGLPTEEENPPEIERAE